MLRTKVKLRIAQVFNRLIVGSRSLLGLASTVRVLRGGLRWELDLNEGVDLAIYLGMYQKIPKRLMGTCIRSRSVVIDIGANIGAHGLPMANHVGKDGYIVAVEPTQYAFGKLTGNIKLNPVLAERMVAVHAALTEPAAAGAPETSFYSRWPLRGSATDRHTEHLGQFEAIEGARFLTLDDMLAELRNDKRIEGSITFIKLDVDGNELKVLKGGQRTLERERPVILIEIAPHVQDEVPQRFEQLLEFLSGAGYRLEYAKSGKPMPSSAADLRKLIKHGASIDTVARPR